MHGQRRWFRNRLPPVWFVQAGTAVYYTIILQSTFHNHLRIPAYSRALVEANVWLSRGHLLAGHLSAAQIAKPNPLISEPWQPRVVFPANCQSIGIT